MSSNMTSLFSLSSRFGIPVEYGVNHVPVMSVTQVYFLSFGLSMPPSKSFLLNHLPVDQVPPQACIICY